jgi:xylulokinase
MSYLMGTDIGTLGTKSILIDLGGKILSSAFEEYDVLTPRPGWAEQWPEVWFTAACNTIRTVIRNSRVDRKEIAGICISGLYGGSGIPCDQRMKALRPCIIYADRRATEECQGIRERIGDEEIFKVTANVIDPYYGYTKMLWIKHREPHIWRQIHQLVSPHAYCIYGLTNTLSIDYSSAGNYGGIFDIHKRAWSERMMSALGIPRSFFPETISMSKDVVGEVTEEGSKLTGLRMGTPVSAGGIDAPVSSLGVGALEDGDLAVMLGTSMCNGFINHETRLSPKLINFPYVADDKEITYSFAGLVTAGYCIRWFRDQLGGSEAASATEAGLSAYGMLDLEAERVQPGSDGLIFLPHMMVGERAPYWDEYVRGSLMGLTVYHTRAHIFRAFLEGIGYALRHSIDVATEAGIPIKRSLLVDGGAKSKLWREILTDISGLAMIYIAQTPGAPLGDALLAGVGTGVLDDYEVIKEWLEVTEITKPNPKNADRYDGYYQLFREVYLTNLKIYQDLKKLTG